MSRPAERPSPVLLVMLVVSVLVAAVYYGGVFGGDEPIDDAQFAEADDAATTEPAAPIVRWEPPAQPRDPFAPVGGFGRTAVVDPDGILTDD